VGCMGYDPRSTDAGHFEVDGGSCSRARARGTVDGAMSSHVDALAVERHGTTPPVSPGDCVFDRLYPVRHSSLARVRSRSSLAQGRLDSVCFPPDWRVRHSRQPGVVRPSGSFDHAVRGSASLASDGDRGVCSFSLRRVVPDLQPLPLSDHAGHPAQRSWGRGRGLRCGLPEAPEAGSGGRKVRAGIRSARSKG